jgi:(p)ppGpp synthase/HD superfamily hydrolase
MSHSERFEEALIFAYRTHSPHYRKGTKIPYVAHILSVAGIAIEHGADEDEAIAALLHDAIEDGGGAVIRVEIQRRFGSRVAGIVEECTDTDETPKPPWRIRKELYIKHLETASPSGRFVSAADKLHNARAILEDYRSIGEELWERFNAGRDDILWYYNSLVAVLKNSGVTPLVAELDRVVDEIARLVKERTNKPRT